MQNNVALQFILTTPPVTRTLLLMTAIVSMAVYLGILVPQQISYSRFYLLDFELHRILTTFLYHGKTSFELLMNIVFFYRYSSMLEDSYGRTSDYFFTIIVICLTLLAAGTMFYMPFLASALSSTITYIWTRKNPQSIVQVFGFISFSAFYLPFVFPTVSLIFDGGIAKEEVFGIVVGHLIFYFMDVYPRFGRDFLRTPCIFHRLFSEKCSHCNIGNEVSKEHTRRATPHIIGAQLRSTVRTGVEEDTPDDVPETAQESASAAADAEVENSNSSNAREKIESGMQSEWMKPNICSEEEMHQPFADDLNRMTDDEDFRSRSISDDANEENTWAGGDADDLATIKDIASADGAESVRKEASSCDLDDSEGLRHMLEDEEMPSVISEEGTVAQEENHMESLGDVQSNNAPEDVQPNNAPGDLESNNSLEDLESNNVPEDLESNNVPEDVQSNNSLEDLEPRNAPEEWDSCGTAREDLCSKDEWEENAVERSLESNVIVSRSNDSQEEWDSS